MMLKVYSVYDVKVQAYSTPFFSVNDSTAFRSFSQLRNDPATQVNQFPDDFRLYRLGDFDDSSGLLVAQVPPVLIQEDSHA